MGRKPDRAHTYGWTRRPALHLAGRRGLAGAVAGARPARARRRRRAAVQPVRPRRRAAGRHRALRVGGARRGRPAGAARLAADRARPGGVDLGELYYTAVLWTA